MDIQPDDLDFPSPQILPPAVSWSDLTQSEQTQARQLHTQCLSQMERDIFSGDADSTVVDVFTCQPPVVNFVMGRLRDAKWSAARGTHNGELCISRPLDQNPSGRQRLRPIMRTHM
jgi:hypothetical protein